MREGNIGRERSLLFRDAYFPKRSGGEEVLNKNNLSENPF